MNGNNNTTVTEQVTGNETEEWTETKCSFCKQILLESSEPKLLPCLHSACKACLLAESSSSPAPNSSTVPSLKPDVCPSCSQEIKHSDVIDHLFLLECLSQSSDNIGNTEESKIFTCTSCEDSALSSGFCVECQEWLCDACIQAHQRVRVTKDHAIRPKEDMEGERTTGLAQKYLFCPLHRQEQLKLYCESCDKVTCRDCQLLEHQDHRYQFLSKACEDEKLYLGTLLTKIKEKQAYIKNARTTVNKRHNEITQREQNVNEEIKMCAVRFITEINRRAKQLLHQLSEVCTQKKTQLSMKNEELVSLSFKLEHCLKFTENAMKHGSEMALVYSKKAITNQLRHVLRRRCEVPNPQHVVDIHFSYESNYLTQYISQLGCLFVDRQPVGGMISGILPRGQHIAQPQGQNAVTINQNCFPVQSSNQTTTSQLGSTQERQSQNQPHTLYGQPQVTSSTHPAPMIPGHLRNILQAAPLSNQFSRSNVANVGQSLTPVTTQTSFSSSTATVPKQLQSNIRQTVQQPQVYQPVTLPRNPNITISPVTMTPNKQNIRNIRPAAPRLQVTAIATQSNPTNTSSQLQKVPSSFAVLQPVQPRPQVIVIDSDASSSNKVLTMSNTPKLSHYPIVNSSVSNMTSVTVNNATINQISNQGNNVAQSSNIVPHVRPARSCDNSPLRTTTENTNLLPSNLSDVLDKNSVTITNVQIKPEPKSHIEQFSSCAAARSSKELEKPTESPGKNIELPVEVLTVIPNTNEASSSTSIQNKTTSAESSSSPLSTNIVDESPNFSTSLTVQPDVTVTETQGDTECPLLPDCVQISTISTVLQNFVLENKSKNVNVEEVDNKTEKSVNEPSKQTELINENSNADNENSSVDEFPALEDILIGNSKTKETHIPGRKNGQSNQEDPNEDWCAVCHDGGVLLCCGSCPRVFHLFCHVPVLNSTPSEDWKCLMCMDVLNAPVPDENNGTKRKNSIGLCGRELLICERILLELLCHESSPPFHEPISREVPNYYKVITKPMDMSTVRSKLLPNHFNHYRDVEEFLADVRLIFRNCCTFNQKDSELYDTAKFLEEFFDELLNKYLPEHAYDVTVGSQGPSVSLASEDEEYKNKRQRKDTQDESNC